ncbi:hypothetical protein RSOL_393520, partial [Rhizoctonia solani AG-3 Rhs1AP]
MSAEPVLSRPAQVPCVTKPAAIPSGFTPTAQVMVAEVALDTLTTEVEPFSNLQAPTASTDLRPKLPSLQDEVPAEPMADSSPLVPHIAIPARDELTNPDNIAINRLAPTLSVVTQATYMPTDEYTYETPNDESEQSNLAKIREIFTSGAQLHRRLSIEYKRCYEQYVHARK